MNDDQSRVEAANERLYSRTRYHDPNDARSELSPSQGNEPEAGPTWQSPSIDEMLEGDRRQGERRSKARSFLNRVFVFALGFFVVAVAVASYIYFAGSNFISSRNVDITVRGPVTISAGGVLDLDLIVKNSNNAELDKAVLTVTYPGGTRNATDPSKSLTSERLDLGTIPAGADMTKSIHAVIFGEQSEVKELSLSLDYNVKGSSATFNKDKSFDVTVGTVPVTIKVDQPDSVTSGQSFTTKLTLTANSTDTLRGVLVRAEYPYGFSFSNSDPAASSETGNLWSLGDIAPGDTKTITIHGSILGENNEERTFRFSAGIGDSSNQNVFNTSLATVSQTLSINRPDVGLDFALNGDDSDTYVAPPGHPVQGSVKFTNNMPSKLLHAKVVTTLNGTALDRFSVQVPNGGFYDSANNQIVWDESSDPDLASVSAGEVGDFSFQFSSLTNLSPGTRNQEIDLVTTVSGMTQNNTPLTVSLSRSVKLASEISLTGRSSYSRGPFKNTGGIPPHAEKATTYTITLDLKNTRNDVFKPTVTATLGPNVTWLNKVDPNPDELTYNQSTNTVTWTFNTLSSGAGFSAPTKEINFQVSLAPSIGQIGSVPILLDGIKISGQDVFTNTPINQSIGAITTRVDQDPTYVQGDEVVKK